MLRTERDFKMASRQARIDSLPARERREQEKWANEELNNIPGACVDGYSYSRVDGGYVCHMNICLITDQLLAEGRAGYHLLCMQKSWGQERTRHGPFYPSDEDKISNLGSRWEVRYGNNRIGFGHNVTEGFGECGSCEGTWMRVFGRKKLRSQASNLMSKSEVSRR